MRNVLKATGHGRKHFFGARDSRDDYKAMGGKFKRLRTDLNIAAGNCITF